MHIVDVAIAAHIGSAAKRLAQAAAENGRAVMTFNDISTVANAGDTADDVVRDWNNQSNARHVAWLNSTEGKAAAKKREDTIAAMQDEHDRLMQELRTLDFTDDVAVLDWLCRMQRPSDHVGVAVRSTDIVSQFAVHGFAPNVNTGASYREDDRDNSFRYLVGQALSTLEACAIHGILHDFVARWKARFLNT